CAYVSEVPGASPAAPAAPGAAPARSGVDPQITTTLVALLESKDRYQLDLSNAAGTPLGDILGVGSPIGYNLRNPYLGLRVPLAEALSSDTDPVFRDKLVSLARWDKDGETRAAGLMAVAQKHDIGDLDIFREALIHLDPAVRFGALEALLAWQHPEKALPLL